MQSKIIVAFKDFYGHLKVLTTRWQQQLGLLNATGPFAIPR